MSTNESLPMHLPQHLRARVLFRTSINVVLPQRLSTPEPQHEVRGAFVCAFDGNCVLVSGVFFPVMYGLQRRLSFESVMLAAPPPVGARESARRWAAELMRHGGSGRWMREQRGIVIAGNQYIVK